MEFLRQVQGYSYVAMIFILTIGLYAYIYHLYKSEKDGTKNYEKYSKMALEDDVDDKPVEKKYPDNNDKDK